MDQEELKYLDEAPGTDFPAPPVQTAEQVLPFHLLLWENFERLCLRLARARAEVEDARLFGVRGQDQSGIDIYCREQDGYSVYQCRRVKKLGAAALKKAVDDFLAEEWAGRAQIFVFCTSHSAVRTELANEIATQAARLSAHDPPIRYEVWDAEELSAQLKRRPDLVSEFFGPAWLKAFAPDAATADIDDRLADVAAGLHRLEQSSLRVVVLDWAPSALRDALRDLADRDGSTFARLDDEIGNPPVPERVVSAIETPPRWLRESDASVWRILAMAAEEAGEWNAARDGWLALVDRTDGDDERAGFTVAAAVAADLAGDSKRSAELLDTAEQLAPRHPRVLLQRLDQRQGGRERLAVLEGIESDEPNVAALIAVHRATANMLVPDMEAARQYVEQAQRLMPESLAVKATAVNAVVQEGRINTNESRSVDLGALTKAHDDALNIRDRLLGSRRYEEALRLLMLAADALTVLKEFERARRLIRTATPEELAMPDAPEVLGDAALKALGWDEARRLTDNVEETEGVVRIRASADLHGALYEQNRALEVLDKLVAERGPEAAQAAHARLAATLGSRGADWSDDAESALVEQDFEFVAVSLKTLFLTMREKNYQAAQALLSRFEREPWAEVARLRVAVMRSDADEMRRLATAILDRGPAQEDRIECAVALAMAGELSRAREVLTSSAQDPATPPAIRGNAYSYLVPLLAERLGDWEEAATIYAEWVELRLTDKRTNEWAPRIANRRRSN